MSDDFNLTTTKEYETNYFRLVKLTMKAGTKAIEQTVTRHFSGGQSLHAMLQQKEGRIRSSKTGNSFVFNSKQLATLYPATGNCNLSSIDMTLWCSLARNFAAIPKRLTVNWDRLPVDGEVEWFHDICRIRETRNKLCHLNAPELDTENFKELWNYVSGALRRLNPSVDLEEYSHAEYDRAAARDYQLQVKEQVLQEMNDVLRAGLAERRHIVTVVVVIGVLILILIAATVTVIYFQLRQASFCGKGKRSETSGSLGTLTIMPREGWQARDPSDPLIDLKIPVEIVEYTHTADVTGCTDCCRQVYNIQYMHMNVYGWSDIAFHYLIDDYGLVYEGRPPNKVSAALWGWNFKIISIALLGNYMHEIPKVRMLNAFDALVLHLVERHLVVSNFSLYAMCDLSYNYTDSPGPNLYYAVRKNDGGYESFKHAGDRREAMCFFNHSLHGDRNFEEEYDD